MQLIGPGNRLSVEGAGLEKIRLSGVAGCVSGSGAVSGLNWPLTIRSNLTIDLLTTYIIRILQLISDQLSNSNICESLILVQFYFVLCNILICL